MLFKKMDKLYGKKEEFKPEQIVLDYVAGMTDQYALQCAQEIIFPQPISLIVENCKKDKIDIILTAF